MLNDRKHTQRLVGVRVGGSLWTNIRADASESNDCLLVVEVRGIKAADDHDTAALVKLSANRTKLVRQS